MIIETDSVTGIQVTSATSLEAVYHSKIPISQHMGLKVRHWDGETLELSAPLTNNINHQGSGFGGSLFSVAALAGWGLLQLKMSELALQTNTVIAGGEVKYTAPVYADFTCRCRLPGTAQWEQFKDKLLARGKASLTLAPDIWCEEKPCMAFHGHYVLSII